MKVAIFRCDACGKMLDDGKDIIRVNGMDFCEACTRSIKHDIEVYAKKLDADIKNEKFKAFVERVYLALVAYSIDFLRAEALAEEAKIDNTAKAGFSQ